MHVNQSCYSFCGASVLDSISPPSSVPTRPPRTKPPAHGTPGARVPPRAEAEELRNNTETDISTVYMLSYQHGMDGWIHPDARTAWGGGLSHGLASSRTCFSSPEPHTPNCPLSALYVRIYMSSPVCVAVRRQKGCPWRRFRRRLGQRSSASRLRFLAPVSRIRVRLQFC
jgi:hypothetical protein